VKSSIEFQKLILNFIRETVPFISYKVFVSEFVWEENVFRYV